jgi:hypothetical protein
MKVGELFAQFAGQARAHAFEVQIAAAETFDDLA